MAEFQKESLSLEEANRVRISLGLKPLVDVDVHDDDDERDHNNQNGDHDRVDSATSSIPPTSIGSTPPDTSRCSTKTAWADTGREPRRGHECSRLDPSRSASSASPFG